MKKFTSFLALTIAFGFGLNAQNISFETSEGYTLGDINGQNHWITTEDGAGGFIENQVITDEAASDGSYSLKLTQEPDLPGSLDPYVGGFYNYATPVSMDNAEISAAIYIDDQNPLHFNFLMGLVDLQEERYRTYINFFFDGTINVFVKGGPTGIQLVYTGHNWEKETWYNVKIETVGEDLKFYINEELIYEGIAVSEGLIDQVRFAHDNYEGFAYVDNFRTNETLAVSDYTTDVDFTHFYNKNSQILTLKSQDNTFSNISIFDILGQNMLTEGLSKKTENIDMSRLISGVYIVKLNIGKATKTFKFLKQ
ncbi:T9SS type A sorting domain-containing protein [Aequorivita capsosiphonis]|uniref:T9SS type A sorting domain-containing protein n=1 Tax=Aequorivita capsosiphonis TaxID=487317 RepID=UPI000401919E|nr:T9SS type A sorting domain-containing protein [Aequorivita capsosiphonis]